MAARSVWATFTNRMNIQLTLASQVLEDGTWASPPPRTIGPGCTVSWSSAAQGFRDGTAVQVVYSLPGGLVVTRYENPFRGSNSISLQAPTAYHGRFAISSGETATATYTLSAAT